MEENIVELIESYKRKVKSCQSLIKSFFEMDKVLSTNNEISITRITAKKATYNSIIRDLENILKDNYEK